MVLFHRAGNIWRWGSFAIALIGLIKPITSSIVSNCVIVFQTKNCDEQAVSDRKGVRKKMLSNVYAKVAEIGLTISTKTNRYSSPQHSWPL